MDKPNLLVSVSGGETSGFMAKIIQDLYSDVYEIVYVFANTGFEHPKTLDFVKAISDRWGIPIVWLEAAVHDSRKACTSKVVSYETASRSGEPFIEVMEKYGLCNKSYPHCNRELKLHPIHDYAKNVLGWKKGEYSTAIGIRTDEDRRRASPKTAELWGAVYPLLDWNPSDKQDVSDFWEDQPFSLGIAPYQGNCQMCFKKSDKKIIRMIQTDRVSALKFKSVEEATRHIKADEPRKPFRQHRTTADMIALADSCDPIMAERLSNVDGGCSESCDILIL